jgi:hypothetical protein
MARPVEEVDQELRLVAAVRAVCRDAGGPTPTAAVADGLLDERAESRDDA